MNKFTKLAKTLIQNKLWCSKIQYVKRKYRVDKLTSHCYETETIYFTGVIKSVSKNLIDNVNILRTDTSIVIDSITLRCYTYVR